MMFSGRRLEFPYGEKSLSDYVKKLAKDMPDKVGINYYGRKVSLKELDESSDRLAAAIADMGYKKGDRVAAFLQPSPQCYILYLAAMRLGLIIVPIDPMSMEFELEYALNDSGATLIVAFDQLYPVVKRVKDKCKIKDVILTSFGDYLLDKPELPLHKMMKTEKQTFSDTHGFLKLIEKYPPNPPKVDVRLDDNAWILYTGGTTGYPKGCLHTQYDHSLSALGLCEIAYGGATKDDTLLVSWPHTHISGISFAIGPLFLTGLTVIPLVRWDAITAMEAIAKYKVTMLHWTVPQYADIINHPENKNYDFSSLRLSLYVPFGMMITEDIVERWQKLTNCPLHQIGYGSSEHMNYGFFGVNLPIPQPPILASGYPLPGFQARILDFETGQELPLGEEGEIVTKEPAQLREYWNKPEESKRDIVDGWLHTHDRGYIDKEGIMYFMGKKADICKVSGYTVALREVEVAGLTHPAVDKIAVVALPDPRKENRLKAFVILKAGAELTASELEEWFKQKVAAFKRPTIEIRAELPTSGKGDILKRELLAQELKKT